MALLAIISHVFNILKVQLVFQVIMFHSSICIQTRTLERFFFFLLRPSICSNHVRVIVYSTVVWQCSPGDLDSPSHPNNPSPGQFIEPDPAPIIHFRVSTIMAALYSIMPTLIKDPSPYPFPEWNLLPLPQSWDNGPCYNREQGPTVSMLLAYSPGLIILTLWGTVLLGKALGLGVGWGGGLKFPFLVPRQASAQRPMRKQWQKVTSVFNSRR